jgi:type I restriction enzyme M protein
LPAHDYLSDRPEAEDIGGAINAAMKAIADENEELGGALPRNYNSLEKPHIEQYFKENFGSDAMTVK